MIEPVTIGPIPRSISVPPCPAKNARYMWNMSIESGDMPKIGMFERAKYKARMPAVHVSFFLRCTCPSGLVTAGNLARIGLIASLKLIATPLTT